MVESKKEIWKLATPVPSMGAEDWFRAPVIDAFNFDALPAAMVELCGCHIRSTGGGDDNNIECHTVMPLLFFPDPSTRMTTKPPFSRCLTAYYMCNPKPRFYWRREIRLRY